MAQLYVLNTRRNVLASSDIMPYQIGTLPQLTGISSRLNGLTIQRGICLSEMRNSPSLTRQIEILYSDILLSERISQERERFERENDGFRRETIPEAKRILIVGIENKFGDLLVLSIEIEETAIENVENEIGKGTVFNPQTFSHLHDVIKNISENHKSLARQVEQSSDTELIQQFNELGLRIKTLERKFDETAALLISTNHDYDFRETSSSLYALNENTSNSDTIEDLINQLIFQWFIDSLNARKEEETEKLAEEKRKKEEEMKAYLRRLKKKRAELKILLKRIEAKLSAAALSTTVSLDEFRRLKILASQIENQLKKLPIIEGKLPLAA